MFKTIIPLFLLLCVTACGNLPAQSNTPPHMSCTCCKEGMCPMHNGDKEKCASMCKDGMCKDMKKAHADAM
jgi:hypothetical protein